MPSATLRERLGKLGWVSSESCTWKLYEKREVRVFYNPPDAEYDYPSTENSTSFYRNIEEAQTKEGNYNGTYISWLDSCSDKAEVLCSSHRVPTSQVGPSKLS